MLIAGYEMAYPITVGNNVWFGGHVTVLPDVTISDNTVIGAGSVVTRDILTTVFGSRESVSGGKTNCRGIYDFRCFGNT